MDNDTPDNAADPSAAHEPSDSEPAQPAQEGPALPSLFDGADSLDYEAIHRESTKASRAEPAHIKEESELKSSLASTAERIYGVIVRRPVAVTMVALAFMVFGGVAFMDLPVKLMPDLTYPTLTVRTNYPAAAPDKVVTAVSEPIQDRIGNIDGLKAHSSTSRQEQSDIVLEFQWGTNMLEASSNLQEAINRVNLDRDIETPQILRFDPAQDPFMRLMLYGTEGGVSLERLRTFAEDTIKPELAKLPGVATVRISGGVKRYLKITPDRQKIESYGLSVTQITSIIRRENIDQSVGLVNDRGVDVLMRVTSKFRGVEDIANLTIPLPAIEGQTRPRTVKLSELALVQFEDEPPESVTRFANLGTEYRSREGVLLEILKMGDANIIDVADTVRNALFGKGYADKVQRDGEAAYPDREARNTLVADARAEGDGKGSLDRRLEFGLLDALPPSMGISVLTDQSVFIESSVSEVRNAVLIGGILAILIIFLFLKSAWATFLISLSIILSVIATFIPMGMNGLSLNLMSLGGLALGVGMLVDNSIVVLESIARCREEGDDPVHAAARGTGEVAAAIIASTLTTIAVFFPIVFVQGMVGQVFKEQSLTVVFSLLASLVVALLVIPAYAGLRAGRPASGLGFAKEMLFRLLAQGKWSSSTTKNIIYAPVYLLNSIIVGLIFVLLAMAALFVLVMAGVLWSLFVALVWAGKFTLVPLSMLWMTWWRGIEKTYAPILRAALDKPAMVIGLAAGAFVISLLIGRGLDTELIPPLNETEFYIDVEAPEGTRLTLTDRAARDAIEDSFQDHPELSGWVRSVMTEVGGDAASTNRPVSSATVRYVVNLSKDAPDMLAVGDDIKEAADDSTIFDTKSRLSRASLFSLKRPIVVQVRGKDDQLLALAADEVARLLNELKRSDGEPMMREIKTSTERGSPQIRIELDQRKLDRYGLSKRAIADALVVSIKGEEITDYEEQGEKMAVFINLNLDSNPSEALARMRDQEVAPESNPGLRLGELLKDGPDSLVPIRGPSRILRTETERVVEVTATPNGVALGTIRDAIRETVAKSGIESDEVRITASGQMEELDESNASLYFALGLAVFLVYVVMAVQFESLIDPLLIMGAVPLAAVGVIFMLWVSGSPVSVIVMLGGIVLAGIVVNNAIVLIDYANRLRATGLNTKEAVYQAGQVRLRPIAITTITTVLGMLPMTGWLDPMLHLFANVTEGVSYIGAITRELAGSGEGQELRAPMAKTVVVGLTTSTFLTLVVIPTLYALVHGDKPSAKSADSGPRLERAAVDAK